jgi:CBS domain-containing protein
MKIREIMTPEVITVDTNASVADIADILFKHRFHGIPVVEKGKLAGIITESDFFLKDSINTYLPAYVQFIKENRVIDNLPEDIQAKIKKLINVKARDIMTRDPLVAFSDMEATELMEIIKKTTFTTFPVIDEKKNILGIVTLSDILGIVKSGSRQMTVALDENKKVRKIDKLIRDMGFFWKDKYILLSKSLVKSWLGGLIIAASFLALCMAFWFLYSEFKSRCDFDNRDIIPIECQKFTYSEWSECQQDGVQTRAVISSLPKGCASGRPELIRGCQK